MFTTVQHTIKNAASKSKTRDFKGGTPLVTVTFVKHKSTYREFTLVIGVFVALIVALTIWAAQKQDEVAVKNFGISTRSASPSIQEFVSKAVSVVNL